MRRYCERVRGKGRKRAATAAEERNGRKRRRAIREDDEEGRVADALWSSTTGELARAYDRFGVLEAEDLGMRSRQVPGGDGLDGLRWPGEAEYLRTKRRIKGLMRAEALAGDEFWMAIGNRSRMIEAFAPTAVWRRTVMAGLPADGRTGAYLATLAGCLRAAPLCRSVEGFRERRCACGYTTSETYDDLDVHFLLGVGRDGVRCKCAVRMREEWHERVFETLKYYGCGRVIGETVPTSRERTAVMMGTPGVLRAGPRARLPLTGQGRPRVRLPVKVQRALGACAGETRSEGAPARSFFPSRRAGVVFDGKA